MIISHNYDEILVHGKLYNFKNNTYWNKNNQTAQMFRHALPMLLQYSTYHLAIAYTHVCKSVSNTHPIQIRIHTRAVHVNPTQDSGQHPKGLRTKSMWSNKFIIENNNLSHFIQFIHQITPSNFNQLVDHFTP